MGAGAIGLIGGIVGAALGILGGVAGAYFSIKNTDGPHERIFMIRMATACWAAVIAFGIASWLTPSAYRPLLWLPYGPLLFLAVRASNRRQEHIRREEALDVKNGEEDMRD